MKTITIVKRLNTTKPCIWTPAKGTRKIRQYLLPRAGRAGSLSSSRARDIPYSDITRASCSLRIKFDSEGFRNTAGSILSGVAAALEEEGGGGTRQDDGGGRRRSIIRDRKEKRGRSSKPACALARSLALAPNNEVCIAPSTSTRLPSNYFEQDPI